MIVTIELTDEMVTALRAWARTSYPTGASSFQIDQVVATLVLNELPPPPVHMPLSIDPRLAEKLSGGATLTDNEVERLVRAARESAAGRG